MNEFDYNFLREKSWRNKLTAAEEASLRAWLAEHPEAKADWELESGLSAALDKLPDAPVPSNFTARVMQAVAREDAAARRPATNRARWFLRSLLPKAAMAAVLLGAGVLTYHEHAAANAAKRAELVRGVKIVATEMSVPTPEVLQDFDTIHKISRITGPDPELIALMK
jgi:anti-sigma factor RsiW